MDELKVKVTSKSYRKKDTDKIRDCTVNQNIYTVTGLTSLLTSVIHPIVSPAIRPSVSPLTAFDSNTKRDKDWSVLGDLNDPSMGLVIDTESKTIRQQTLEEHTDPKNWNSTICDDCINQFSGWDTECRHKIDLDSESASDLSDSKSVSSSDYHSESESELDEEQEEIREWIYCLKNELYYSLNSLYAASFYNSESDNNSGIDSTRVKQCHLLASDYISEFCNNLESLVYDCYIDLPKRTLQDIKVLLNLCQNKCSYALHSPLSLNRVIYNYLSGETRNFRGKSKDFDDVIKLFFYDMYPFDENKNNDKKEHICTPILSSIFGSGFKSQTPATIPSKTSEKDEFMKICQEIMSNPSLDNFRKLTSGIKPDLSNKSTSTSSCPFSCSFSCPSSLLSPEEVNSLDFLLNFLSQYTPSPVVPLATKELKSQSPEPVNQSQTTRKDDRKIVDDFLVDALTNIADFCCLDEESKKAVDKVKKDCIESMDLVDSSKKNGLEAIIACITNILPSMSLFFNKNGEDTDSDMKQDTVSSKKEQEQEQNQEQEQPQSQNNTTTQFTDFCENVKNILPDEATKEKIDKINQCFQESMNNVTGNGQGLLSFMSGIAPMFLNTDTMSGVDIKLYNPGGTEYTPKSSSEQSSDPSIETSSKQENDCDLSEKDRAKSVSYSNDSANSNSNNKNSETRELCDMVATVLKQFCSESGKKQIDKVTDCANEVLNKPLGPDSTINFISSVVNNVLTEETPNDSQNNSVNEPKVPYPSEPVNNKQESNNNNDFLSNLINSTLSSSGLKDNNAEFAAALDTFLNKVVESFGSKNTNKTDMKPSWIHLINEKQSDSSKANDLISLFSTPLPDNDSTTQSATEPATESSIVSNTPSNTSSNTEATTESNMEETNNNSKSEVTITDYDSDIDQFLEC